MNHLLSLDRRYIVCFLFSADEGGAIGIHEASQLTGAFIQDGATEGASGRTARPCSSGSRLDLVLRRCLMLLLKEAESKSVQSELTFEALL